MSAFIAPPSSMDPREHIYNITCDCSPSKHADLLAKASPDRPENASLVRVARKAKLLAFCRASCVDMRYCAATKRLYTMHDCTFLMVTPAGQRNALQAVDVERKTVVATAHEFSEQYELICMAPLGGHGDWGNELVAGAVHGSASLLECHSHHFCTSCLMFTNILFACISGYLQLMQYRRSITSCLMRAYC